MKNISYLLVLCFLTLSRAMAVNLDFIQGGTITSDITINVPSDYTTLQAAFDALSNRSVKETATITIQIADGTYSSAAALVPPRTVGANLQILGNVSNPSAVVLSFPNNTTGFYLTNGQVIKFVNGMTIDGMYSSPAGTYTVAAFWLYKNCSLALGSAMVLRRFPYGISTNLGSVVECNGITVSNNICGIAANGSSSVFAFNVTATNNTNNGFYANYCGNIVAYGSTATGSISGFFADMGGVVIH